MHVSTGNEKIIKGKEKDVIRKMKENSELVFDLNLMRKRENEYLIDIKEKDTEISRLRREINGLSTRSQTANTGITCRVAPSRDLFSQDRMLHVGDNDLRDYGKGESNSRDSGTRETVTRDSVRKQGQSRRIIQGRSRVESANKTMMWREEKSERSSRLTSIVREL